MKIKGIKPYLWEVEETCHYCASVLPDGDIVICPYCGSSVSDSSVSGSSVSPL